MAKVAIMVEVDASDVETYLGELKAAASAAQEIPEHLQRRIERMAEADDGWFETEANWTDDKLVAVVRPDGEALSILASLRAVALVAAN